MGALALGTLPVPAFAELAGRTVPILSFVLAMSLVTELLDEAGLFRVVTDRLAALGRGRVFFLWLLVIALATVSTVFLSLDTTAVLVTPVVVLLAVHARIPPLPFALTSIWLANTASLLLPVSNLTNLLAQDRLGLSPAGIRGPCLGARPGGTAGSAHPVVAGVPGRPARQVRARSQSIVCGTAALLIFAAGTVLVLLPALVSGVPVQYPAMAAAAFLLAVFLRRRPCRAAVVHDSVAAAHADGGLVHASWRPCMPTA